MPIQHFPLETTNCTPSPSIRITNGTECKVLIAITVPTRNWKYIFKVRTDILIGELRKQAIETYNLKELDFINYGLYLPPESGKKGKFLQDERTISEYPQLVAMKLNPYNDNQLLHEIESNGLMNDRKSKEPVVLELLPKIRFVEEYRLEGSKSTTKRIHSKHHQKRLLSAIKRNDIGRVTDLLEQGLDPNFQYPSSGVIPLGCAAELTDPREMILQLVNAGAHLDYRDSNTMTALHRAAINGNLKAIEVFLELGQNPNVRDKNNLTPLYYACSEDIQPECIQRLLFDHAILGVTDDKGRQEIHQACLNGRSKTLKQLIIYGADLNAQVENHNTPLHLCVLADEMDCLNLLLRYGASPTLINLSGQTPYELAILIERMNLANILQNFDEHLVEGIDQKPVYNKDRRPTIHGPRAVYDSVHLLQYNHNSNHSNSNNNNNNNNGNTISTRKPSKPMSVDRELPPTPYQRCLSFDMNDLKQLTPKRINQYVFHNNKIESRTPDIVRRNNLDKNETTMNNNRPLLPIRRQMTYSNDNDNCGGTIYNDNNSQDIPKFPRRLNFLRQRYPNYRIRSIILERGITGYGFIMQGSDNFKERSFIANNLPSQGILSVQRNSKAEKAGLIPGDYILEINGMDVYDATHTQVVDLITTTRDMLQLKIINFQQLPEIQSRVINGNHSNSNNNTTTTNNNSIITNTNFNYSNNNIRIMHRTSFLRADLRRRNTQRSTSVDMAWNTRQLSIDNNTMDNNHNITTATTTTTTTNNNNNDNNNNNNYRRSIHTLNISKTNYLERKSQSAVLIIKDETEQLKDSSRTTTTTTTAQPLSTTLSSSSSSLSPSISSSLSPHTYADITNFNDSSNYNNQLECHISKSSNLLLSNELKNSELDPSATTPTITTLHNELTNRQNKYKFTMKSLSSLTTTTTTTTTTTSPSSSSSSSSFSAQHLLYLSSSSLSSKYKQDNKMMNTLKQYHNESSDHKWDSESDLLNISEITEISVISMNDETLNNNIDKVVEYKKQSNFIKPSTVNILTPSLMSSTSTTSSSSSPVKNKLTNEVNFHMNGKLRSIQSEPYLHQMKAEANNGNNKNNYNNHSCNDIEASTVQKAPINNNLKINGHEIDDDESDSCLI
ncbi:unnamed protein product [Schistosoma mattheei]|nr:unnamed protein product [Schistosoma mattheei]